MHSATPEPAASKSSLSIPPSVSGWSSATTVAGSILKCCMRDATDIGGSRVCANGRKELVPDSEFGAAPPPEQKSFCPSLIPSPSNPEWSKSQQDIRRIHRRSSGRKRRLAGGRVSHPRQESLRLHV